MKWMSSCDWNLSGVGQGHKGECWVVFGSQHFLYVSIGRCPDIVIGRELVHLMVTSGLGY